MNARRQDRRLLTGLLLALLAGARPNGQAWCASFDPDRGKLLLALATQLSDPEYKGSAASNPDEVKPAPGPGVQTPEPLMKISPQLGEQETGAAVMSGAALPSAISTAGAADNKEAKTKYRFVMPPIRYWGEVSYDIRREGGDNQQSTLSQYLTLQVNAETFLWQPWFSRLSGGLGLLTTTTSAESQQKSETLTGNARRALLAMSRFPFEAFYDRTDSRADIALAGTQYVSTRYGLNQRYTPMGGSSNFLFSYEHNNQERADGIQDAFDGLELDMNHRRGSHFFDFNARLTQNDSSDGKLDNSYTGVVLRHTYIPHSRFTMENLASMTGTDDNSSLNAIKTRFIQFNDFWSWRPEGDKWYVSGGFRALQLSNEAGGGGSTNESRSISANLGANYQLNRLTQVTGSAAVTHIESANDSDLQSTQTLGISRQADPIPLGKYQYQWFTGASASNRTGGTDSGQHLSAQLGHVLDRSYDLSPGSTLSFNAGQSLSGDVDTQYDALSRIGHSAAATWMYGKGESTGFVRFSASDSRTLAGRQEIYQILNFQATINNIQNRSSSWTGNVTVQATRQITEDSPDAGFALTTSGDITYQNGRLFGIPRLRFLSQLRLNQNSFSQQNTGTLKPAARDQETVSWENRLDYIVGRTSVSFNARVSEINGRMHDLLQLKLVRQFGDL